MNLLDLMVKISIDDQATSKVGGVAQNITGKLGSALKTVGTVMAGVGAAAGAGAIAIGKAAVESYASYEQLAGGVEKLYGDASDSMMKYAREAYKTSGMSMNSYMEQATSFSASLINSLGGDVDKAASQTDKAMRLMSDNVNTFGTDAEAVQNAIQGLSRENYTMLDNLKLGYSGTKEGMESLIKDAEEYAQKVKGMSFDEYAESMQKTGLSADELRQRYDELSSSTDLTMGNFSDMIDAIDIVQEKQNIWGTTAREAATTIEGSVNMTKAAWDNFITSLGTGDQDQIRTAVGGLVTGVFGTWDDESGKRVGGIINNVAPVVQQVGQAMMAELPSLASTVAYQFLEWLSVSFGNGDTTWVDNIFYAIDDLWETVSGFFDDVSSGFGGSFDSSGFVSAIDNIKSVASDVWDFINENILSNGEAIGSFLGTVGSILGTVADAITTVLDVISPFVPAIAGAVGALALLGPITGIISAVSGAFTFFTTVIVPALGMVQSFGGAIALVTTLLGGPITIIAAVVGAIVAFIATNEDARQAILDAWNAVVEFFTGIPDWWNGVCNMVRDKAIHLVASIVMKWQELKQSTVTAFNNIKAGIVNAVTNAKNTAINAFQSLKNGVSQKVDSLVSFVSSIPSKITSALGNLSSLLLNAGSSIIGGLLNGIRSKFEEVKGFVGGIGNWIASHKGPLDYDRKLLIPNGRAIMQSLGEGLESGFSDYVKDQISGVAGRVATSVTAEVSAPSQSATTYDRAVIQWLETRLPQVIRDNASTTPREFGRMVREYA